MSATENFIHELDEKVDTYGKEKVIRNMYCLGFFNVSGKGKVFVFWSRVSILSSLNIQQSNKHVTLFFLIII